MRHFTEVQRFDQWWFRLIMLLTAIIVIGSIFATYPQEPVEDHTSFWVAMSSGIFALAVMFFVAFMMRLKTKIDEKGIHYAFFPIHISYRLIEWKEIKECFVRKYSPLTEYGGWGYRFKLSGNSAALNVKGNVGIQIVKHNGEKLLIGTQKEADARQILQYYFKKSNTDV